jgi:hypothetical protein
MDSEKPELGELVECQRADSDLWRFPLTFLEERLQEALQALHEAADRALQIWGARPTKED